MQHVLQEDAQGGEYGAEEGEDLAPPRHDAADFAGDGGEVDHGSNLSRCHAGAATNESWHLISSHRISLLRSRFMNRPGEMRVASRQVGVFGVTAASAFSAAS